ncbi:MAG: hypothetical protein GEV09_10775 [Pseudonocardiaceae bacterium]|nr:hypothetical protein [Pseudonocardiaceae bacterium]
MTEDTVQLTFLGSTSNNGGSPTLFDTDGDTYVVQGWKVLDADTLAPFNLPEHETVIEVPKALLRFAPPAVS